MDITCPFKRRRSYEASSNCFILRLLISVAIVLFVVDPFVVAQANLSSRESLREEDLAHYEMDLYSLSDAELEDICTVRGFELVQDLDESSGEPFIFTHEDYVEAARQCLAIERDMEAIIAENPEILAELEAERDRMMAEKERLEKELVEAEKRRADGRESQTAFLPVESGDEKERSENEIDDDKRRATKQKSSSTSTAFIPDTKAKGNGNVTETVAQEEPTKDSKIHSDPTEGGDRLGNAEKIDGALSTEERPLSIQALARASALELREKVQHDLTRIMDIIFPKSIRGPIKLIVRPFVRLAREAGMNVFDFMIRHVQAIVEQANMKIADHMNASSNDASGLVPTAEGEVGTSE